MVFAYYSIIRSTKKLAANGLLDQEFISENSKKEKKWISVTLNLISLSLTIALVSFCVMGISYRIAGEQITINNQTSLVIASNSMKEYYSEDYQEALVNEVASYAGLSYEEANARLEADQFNTGDMLIFDELGSQEDLHLYQVYGYRNSKGQIIVHRLIGFEGERYVFRGDNAIANDSLVKREQILYSYHDVKLPTVGIAVLFFSSSFGIYSLFIVLTIFVMSDIAKHQYSKIKVQRLAAIKGQLHAC